MDALKLCVRSTSLGDVFTGVLHPATASHRDLSPARRGQLGITDGLVRISVGIESIKDIIADIDQALCCFTNSVIGPTRSRKCSNSTNSTFPKCAGTASATIRLSVAG